MLPPPMRMQGDSGEELKSKLKASFDDWGRGLSDERVQQVRDFRAAGSGGA
jgi:hypothetical protein